MGAREKRLCEGQKRLGIVRCGEQTIPQHRFQGGAGRDALAGASVEAQSGHDAHIGLQHPRQPKRLDPVSPSAIEATDLGPRGTAKPDHIFPRCRHGHLKALAENPDGAQPKSSIRFDEQQPRAHRDP